VADRSVLETAWNSVRRADGTSGSDAVTLATFQSDLERNLDRLQDKISRDAYRFSRLKIAVIPKPMGGERRLGIPTVSDRIVLQSIKSVLEPQIELAMLPCSHAYRAKRGCQTAMDACRAALQAGRTWVLETDIRNFFDSISHRHLTTMLKAIDPRTNDSRLLNQAIRLSGSIFPARKGVAQGSPLSPLISNVALLGFDRRISDRSGVLIRYADDLLLMCSDEKSVMAGLQSVRSELKTIGLELHPDKTRITDSRRSAFSFLGFEIHPDRIVPSAENLVELKSSIVGWCNPQLSVDWQVRIDRINGLLRSFAWYYHQTDSGRIFISLDQFVREQLTDLDKLVASGSFDWSNRLISIPTVRDVVWKSAKSKKSTPRWGGY
jgi:RNA-directed DNA polymerase